MILNGMAYYNKTIRPLNVGTNGYFILKDHNGIVLMHPQLEQWGIDVINGREKMFPGKNLTSLSNMIDRQKQGLTAVDEYYSYWWTKPGAPGVEKVSAYTPAYIGDDYIIVSAVMPLVPGVTFTTAIRDTLNGDYAAGSARILEAIVVGLAVAFGVGAGLVAARSLEGGLL